MSIYSHVVDCFNSHLSNELNGSKKPINSNYCQTWCQNLQNNASILNLLDPSQLFQQVKPSACVKTWNL